MNLGSTKLTSVILSAQLLSFEPSTLHK